MACMAWPKMNTRDSRCECSEGRALDETQNDSHGWCWCWCRRRGGRHVRALGRGMLLVVHVNNNKSGRPLPPLKNLIVCLKRSSHKTKFEASDIPPTMPCLLALHTSTTLIRAAQMWCCLPWRRRPGRQLGPTQRGRAPCIGNSVVVHERERERDGARG